VSFEDVQVAEWANPPVDGRGYFSSADMMGISDTQLRELVEAMRRERYEGWRNYGGRWRDLMGLDSLHGKDVIDWGCGVGLESLELARAGNRVTAADIVGSNVELAARVGELHGFSHKVRPLRQVPPFTADQPATYDVFYCNGVLHHIREPEQVMARAHELLRPGGEARLMVYSDRGWGVATGDWPPPEDIAASPHFMTFVRFFDSVGYWAEWYSAESLEQRFGQWFEVERFSYLTPDDRYCAAVLRRKP
jgi:2-polyprenyl-3-methyl-5-hydroxy-6-metoxy-1,4-benzoquinol methylase